MRELLAGYKRFRQSGWPLQRARFEELAVKGQDPSALIITCIDSRVDPTLVFDTAPGELLVVRNVANLVPPCQPDATYHGTSAALEFSVRILKIPQIVVLGHGLCGGVRALLAGAPPSSEPGFIDLWMSIAVEARKKAMICTDPDERQLCCEEEVVRTSLVNLMTYPWLAERVQKGDLKLYGAWFSVKTGQLLLLNHDDVFASV